MVSVNKCCCFSLETGGYIVGIFGVIISLIAIVVGASLLRIEYKGFIDYLFTSMPEDTYPNSQEKFDDGQELYDFKWGKDCFTVKMRPT